MPMPLHMFGRTCCLSGRHHTLRGVWFSTCKCTTGVRLHALQNSSDARCSSKVEAYQRLFPPSHAWLSATTKASRHRRPPVLHVYRICTTRKSARSMPRQHRVEVNDRVYVVQSTGSAANDERLKPIRGFRIQVYSRICDLASCLPKRHVMEDVQSQAPVEHPTDC